MKLFRIATNSMLIFVLLISMFTFPVSVKAKGQSINSLEQDIAKTRTEIKEKGEAAKLTEAQISAAKANILLISANIEKGEKEIIALNDDILEKEQEIAMKEEEIKKIVNFLEVASGNSVYLNYIFGAEDFTDFIYRVAVTEQLSKYNSELIKQFGEMIEENKLRIEENRRKEMLLKEEQVKLQAEVAKLNSQKQNIAKDTASLEEALKKQEELLKNLRDMGCGLDEDIDACSDRLNLLPPDTTFWRPTNSGCMSSEFGWRTYWDGTKYVSDFHYGIDVSTPIGTPLYSVANGTVMELWYPSAGHGLGNAIYIHHNVNGQTYTTLYAHLNSIVVKVGQRVTKDTLIGYTGNTGQSTGAHLHFSIITGRSNIDYQAWSQTYYNNNLNPRTKVNFPSSYGCYYNRTSKYN